MVTIKGTVVVKLQAACCKRLKRPEQGIGHVRRYQSGHDGRYIGEVMDERGALFDLSVSPPVRWKRISVSFEEDHPFASGDVSIDRRPRCIAILHRNFALPHILSFSLLYKLLCIIPHNVSQILHRSPSSIFGDSPANFKIFFSARIDHHVLPQFFNTFNFYVYLSKPELKFCIILRLENKEQNF